MIYRSELLLTVRAYIPTLSYQGMDQPLGQRGVGVERFDVAVIGAGVTGVATARRLALQGWRVILLEKGADILSGASKANSALLHTGFDAPEGSLELRCMQQGYAEYTEIAASMNLPVLKTGAMVVAWTDTQEAALPEILRAAQRNGVADVRMITPTEIAAIEPQLSPDARAAVLVPGEYVIDPWSPFHGYARQILATGSKIWRKAEVIAGRFDGQHWALETTAGNCLARHVVNCAGLFGDRIDALLLGRTDFTIKPRKGQFVVFDKAAARLLRSIILPVPDARTKGVVLTPTIFGNLLVGPTAEETEDRSRATVTRTELQMLLDRAVALLPALRDMPVTATYAGLRPATEFKEYRIRHEPDCNWVTVGGIRSTGLTASLGIARHVADLLGAGQDAMPVAAPQMPNLAEHLPRDWQSAGYGEIVCHCELVTRREIEAALSGPFPAGDFGGLKRRTRCAMGRCQGFNCMGRIAELTRGRLCPDIAVTP
jgi:glycerol-3-phosphate dehydrogenase